MSRKPLYTRQTLAELLGVSPHTVDRLMKRGVLRAYRVGRKVRFDDAQVDAFLAGVETGAKRDGLET